MIEEIVLEIVIKTLHLNKGDMTLDSKSIDFVVWDSLSHLMIIAAVEEELNISIPFEEALEIDGVKSLIACCKRCKEGEI